MRANIRAACPDRQFCDGPLAVQSASKACELTAWKNANCLMALAIAQDLLGDQDAAIAAIDKAVALLQPGDQRLETCRDMRENFRGNALRKVGVKDFFEQ